MTKDPWADLNPGSMKRVNADGLHDFFWAVVENNAPALVMVLPSDPTLNTKLPTLKNINMQYRAVNGKALIISLLEGAHRSIFETLCRDIVSSAEGVVDEKAALERVIRRTRRWYFLLKGGSSNGLSKEQQRGLVGELAFLKEIAIGLSPETAIEGWMGPEGAAKDFEFPNIYIEIKARRGAAKPYVNISSEDQLSDVDNARLFLKVYDVDSGIVPEGETLHGHVQNVLSLFEDYPDTQDLLEGRLEAAGYDRLHNYEKLRWIVGASRTYEVIDGFPRIITPLLTGVRNVTYAIDLADCMPFASEFNTEMINGYE